jgi:hypothetical protein
LATKHKWNGGLLKYYVYMYNSNIEKMYDFYACQQCGTSAYRTNNDNGCSSCPDNCNSCVYEGLNSKCTSCFDGYYIDTYNNNRCGKCD